MSWRYRFTLLFFLFLFSLIISRLFYWQVVRAQELSSLGQAQYDAQVTLTAIRGEIKTSDEYAIAANKLAYLAFANPKEVKDKEKESEILGKLLDIDEATISAQLSKNKFWVPLKSPIEHSLKEKIEAKKLPGVGFQDQTLRFYPEATTAANLLGFVGRDDEGNDKGYFGLEGYYDRQLRGKDGVAIVVKDARGQPILANMNDNTEKVDGRDLILHIDRRIQFMLDQELKRGIEAYGAVGGTAAIMDPKTGGILAMSSFPTYDPRSYQDFSDKLYSNPFISFAYEPGSTFKPLIMASALDAGLLKADTRCTICAGPVEITGYEIKTWNDKYTANSSMTDVIVHSDNTGMVFTGRLLGLDRMLSYMDKFGIGRATGIDLQGEVYPSLRERDSWYEIDQATATFGQGLTLTPITLLTAFSAIANEGKLMEPHVVAKVETAEGNVIPIPPKQVGRPISAKSAKVMTEMMVKAVEDGESKWAAPKGYRIAGKTGTAQIPVEGHYDANKTIASFVGFAPADDPKFLMLVVVDRPSTSIYGSETAAPIFFNVARNILSYYSIPPTEPIVEDK
ncbi:MAG: penicillin-binding protein 2 [Candidatus Levybacteria bacterium]|nr:penicillin-binding protein 2 [Candidatus Levybacteria bacterium]